VGYDFANGGFRVSRTAIFFPPHRQPFASPMNGVPDEYDSESRRNKFGDWISPPLTVVTRSRLAAHTFADMVLG
jgi:hypothetical protein